MIVLIIYFSLLFIFILFLIRIFLVYKERIRIINRIENISKIEVSFGNYNWQWRFKEFESISDREMVFKFWIPIKSFYKNTKCIKPSNYLN